MDRKIIVIVCLLICLAGLPAVATVTWTIESAGTQKIYNYTYTNTEETGTDPVVGFHVYAPVDESLVVGHDEPAGWVISADPDPTGALDIYWTAETEDAYLFGDSSIDVRLITSSDVKTSYDYVLADFEIGNWGYDTRDMGGTWTMYGSVPVPEGTQPAVPEPCSLLALGFGTMLLTWRRRR